MIWVKLGVTTQHLGDRLNLATRKTNLCCTSVWRKFPVFFCWKVSSIMWHHEALTPWLAISKRIRAHGRPVDSINGAGTKDPQPVAEQDLPAHMKVSTIPMWRRLMPFFLFFGRPAFFGQPWKSSRPNNSWLVFRMIHGARIPDPTFRGKVWSTWTFWEQLFYPWSFFFTSAFFPPSDFPTFWLHPKRKNTARSWVASDSGIPRSELPKNENIRLHF